MKYSFIPLIVLFSNCANGQDVLVDETFQVLKDAYVIYEANPTQKNESSKIVNQLHESIIAFKEKRNETDNLEIINNVLCNLHKNGSSYYSDTQEERRMVLRRAASFVTLALLSDIDKSFTYLKYAKFDLYNNCSNKLKIEFVEEPFLSLLVLEIFLKHKAEMLSNKDLVELKRFLEANEENITEELITRTNILIKEYQETNK